MRKPTLQQAFNKAYRRFVIQKKPAGYNPRVASCVYSTRDRSKQCAIGCSVPDALFDARAVRGFIGNVKNFFSEFPVVAEHFSKIKMNALLALQLCHDTAVSPPFGHPYPSGFHARIKANLTRFAKNRRLTIPKR